MGVLKNSDVTDQQSLTVGGGRYAERIPAHPDIAKHCLEVVRIRRCQPVLYRIDLRRVDGKQPERSLVDDVERFPVSAEHQVARKRSAELARRSGCRHDRTSQGMSCA